MNLKTRKVDHIKLAFESQIAGNAMSKLFYYEPLLSAHPPVKNSFYFGEKGTPFFGKNIKNPIWISSMTGGIGSAFKINKNLAKVANQFGLGFGIGSCRPMLENKALIKSNQFRKILGEKVPYFANLGFAQVENLFLHNQLHKINELVKALECDGLIIHINPIQEWLQKEGDIFFNSPKDILPKILEKIKYPVVIKEVGQGMGPKSLKLLLSMNVVGIEFASLGGTNFAQVELKRRFSKNSLVKDPSYQLLSEWSKIGHTAVEMTQFLEELITPYAKNVRDEKQIIISGGIQSALEGYYLINKLPLFSVYGRASSYLKWAQISHELLERFVQSEVDSLLMAQRFLTIRK